MADEEEEVAKTFLEVLFGGGDMTPGGMAASALKSLLPMIISSQANKGPSKAQDEALKRMMQIATGQYNMQAKQFQEDMPFRSDLFGALRNREAEKAPRIMPKSFTPSNPYERLNRVAPTTTTGFDPSKQGSIAAALMGGGAPALGTASSPYQKPPAIRNPLMPQPKTQ